MVSRSFRGTRRASTCAGELLLPSDDGGDEPDEFRDRYVAPGPDIETSARTCLAGYLVAPYEVADLAAGITRVLKDEARRALLSARARERALERWSPAVVVPQYLQVYEAAIAAHAGRGR